MSDTSRSVPPEIAAQMSLYAYEDDAEGRGQTGLHELTISAYGLDEANQKDADPTDEELVKNGREFLAYWKHEFGPIPPEIVADVARKWPLILSRETIRQLLNVADLARHASTTTGNISDLKSELRLLADRVDMLVRKAT